MTVTDAALATGTVGFTITVSGSNSPPVISATPLTSIDEDGAYGFSVTSTDPDLGDTATYFLQDNPAWMSINASTGEVSGVPTNDDVGPSATITVGVRDTALAEDSLTFIVNVANINDAPTITNTANTSAPINTLYSYIPTVVDPDAGDTRPSPIMRHYRPG